MPEIAILYRLYPSQGYNVDKLSEELKHEAGAIKTEIEEIGFGIQVIKTLFKYDDSKMSSSDIEIKIQKIKGIEQIEVLEESLI